MEKTSNHKSFGKVMEICFNHVFIYAGFEIINMFFKERRSKCKPAYAFKTQNVLNCSCLVMEIWFKVMEKSWKSPGNPLVKMCKNPVLFNGLVCPHQVTIQRH